MIKLHPSIVVGLGDSGAEIAIRIAELVASYGRPELTAVTRTLTLTAGGLRMLGAGGVDAEGGLPLELDTAARPGVWAANYDALLRSDRAVREQLERAVQEVRSFAQGVGIERRSIQLGDDVTVYLVGSLCDPVGSAALVPVLATVHELFGQTFRGMHARVQMVLLAHDLLPDGPAADPLLKARAYTALQELEWVFDGGLRLPYPVSADLVWLLSSRNEENLFLGGYAQLVPVIAHQMVTMLRGEALGDVSSLHTARFDRVQGRSARYSTFGFSQLVFPREHLLARAADAVAARTLGGMPALAERRVGRGELAGEVERFVYANGFNDVLAALGRDDAGNEIWTGYNPGLRILEEDNAQAVLHRLDTYDREFEQRNAPEMQRGIGRRRGALLSVQKERILDYAEHEIIEQPERGTLAEAEAWLAALVGEKSDWVDGDVALTTETLYAVDRDLDRYFEPLLFGRDEGDAPEYAARVAMASGRRRLLQQVKRQLDEKMAVLLQRRELQEARRQELDAADANGADAAGDAGIRPDSAAATSPTPASPADRSTAATQLIVLRAEMESDGRYISQLESETDALTPVYARVHGEVTRLDHAIQNASERRRIFLTKFEALQKAAGERREQFLLADQAYRSRRAELAEWADRRRRWVVLLAVVWAVALLAAAVLLMRYSALRDLPWWSYAAALAAGVAVSALRYWMHVGRRYRELKDQTAAARVQRDTRRDELVQAHVRLRREIYEYDRYDALVNWRTELTDYVRSLRRDVRAFRDELLRRARESAASATQNTLPENPFLEYLLPHAGVDGLLQRHDEEIEMQMREMWRQTPVSAVFREFRSTAGEDRLAPLLTRIRARAEAVFDDLRELTAEQYLAQTVTAEAERRERVARLYRNAAPFAQRITDEGSDRAVRLAYVGHTDALEASVVRAGLGGAEQAHASFYLSPVDTEVSILRLAMAFPAFHFAPVEEARYHLERLDVEQRAAMYVAPDWAREVEDLKPSALRLGGADDEFRQLACLAIAYGCAEQVETPRGPSIHYAGTEFPDYERWVLHLASLAGARDRRALESELRAIRHRSTTEIPAPADTLRAYRESNPSLDPIDRSIIDAELSLVTHSETDAATEFG